MVMGKERGEENNGNKERRYTRELRKERGADKVEGGECGGERERVGTEASDGWGKKKKERISKVINTRIIVIAKPVLSTT